MICYVINNGLVTNCVHVTGMCEQVVNVSREPDSNAVKLVYVMERQGSLVTAVTAVDRMRLIGDQEAALGLGYVVVTKAERTSALSEDWGVGVGDTH